MVRVVLLATVALTFSLTAAKTASAMAIYSYVGDNFTSVEDVDPPAGSYTTSMNASGYFTLVAPLSANHPWGDSLISSVLDYSFFDGRNTLTPSNSSLVYLNIGTDGLADVVEWLVEVVEVPASPVDVGDFRAHMGILNFDYLSTSGFGDEARIEECTAASGGNCTAWSDESGETDHAWINTSVGSWTLVPEPSTAALLMLALTMLAARPRA